MKDSSIWEKGYQKTKRLWSLNPDAKLMQYFDLIKKGNLLDLGIGEGRNALPFTFLGFNVDGVDISETAIKRCKEKFIKRDSTINLIISDLRKYDIKRDNYTIIIVANVLNFFRKSEIDIIMEKIKKGLKEGGIVYLSVFSTLEPLYNSLKESKKEVEQNTFYIDEKDSYVHFFTQEELSKYFSDFELICCCEGLEYDSNNGDPHYHSCIEFMARKKSGV